MKKNVILYTQRGCESCLKLKNLIDLTGISYKTIDVLDYTNIWESIRKTKKEIMYTPTIGVEIPSDNKIIYIAAGIDFDENQDEKALDKLKSLI